MKLTKRIILSKLTGIYDPIGGGAAVLIKAKIEMQELWQLGLSWDADVPPDIRTKWTELFPPEGKETLHHHPYLREGTTSQIETQKRSQN